MALVRRRFLIGGSAASAAVSWLGGLQPALSRVGHGGDLVLGLLQLPRHFNPALQSGFAAMLPGAQLFSTLLVMDAQGGLRPALAEQWSVAGDGLSLRFRLRRGLRFHDGSPLTSDDVKFSLEAVREHHPFRSIFDSLKDVSTPDSLTVVVHLSQPNPALPVAMSTVMVPVLPRRVYGDGADLRTHAANLQAVGSGPFRLAEYRPGEALILERFQDYFLAGHPRVERLILRLFKDELTLLLAFERGDIDVMMLSEPRAAARASRVAGARVQRDVLAAAGPLNWLAFNNRHPKFSDRRVRQAISFAIDRAFLTGRLFEGMHRPATGPIHSGSAFYSTDVEHYRVDPARSVRLLDEAGVVPDSQGRRLLVTLDFIPGVPELRTAAEYLRQVLGQIGVAVTLRSSPDLASWARRVAGFDYELTLDTVWNWGDPAIGVHRSWLSSNIRQGVIWSNTHQYVNPRVDALLASASTERDPAVRGAIYRDFQRLVVDDCPVAFLFESEYRLGWGARVGSPAMGRWGLLSPLDDIGLRQA